MVFLDDIVVVDSSLALNRYMACGHQREISRPSFFWTPQSLTKAAHRALAKFASLLRGRTMCDSTRLLADASNKNLIQREWRLELSLEIRK